MPRRPFIHWGGLAAGRPAAGRLAYGMRGDEHRDPRALVHGIGRQLGAVFPASGKCGNSTV